MGAGWYVACEKSGAKELPHKGKAVLFAQFHLEEIARSLKVPLLKEFFSTNPAAMMHYLQEQGIEPDPDNLPDEMWFEPADAKPTLEALIQRLDDDPGMVQSIEKVRADLRAVLEAINQAAASGERFHIATVMPDLTGRDPEQLRENR